MSDIANAAIDLSALLDLAEVTLHAPAPPPSSEADVRQANDSIARQRARISQLSRLVAAHAEAHGIDAAPLLLYARRWLPQYLEGARAVVLRASVRGQQQTAPPAIGEDTQPVADGLRILTNGIALGNKTRDLTGKPLAVLKSLLASRDRRASAVQLMEKHWDSLATEQNVKDAVKALRAALRSVSDISDPLPCIGRGPDLAWELRI